MDTRWREVILHFHRSEALAYDANNEVMEAKLSVGQGSTWLDVERFASSTTGFGIDTFRLETMQGAAIVGSCPWEWIEMCGKPFRIAQAVRIGNEADTSFARKGVCSKASENLVTGVINSGIDLAVILSETSENALQSGATELRIWLDKERRLVAFLDNGSGIDPEDSDALGTAGASRSRREDMASEGSGSIKTFEASSVRLRMANSESIRRHKLRARWGRYGIGRLARLSAGSRAVATVMSKVCNSQRLLIFQEDMAQIQHWREMRYNTENADISRAQSLLGQHSIQENTGGNLAACILNAAYDHTTSFTYVEISNVDPAFFVEWEKGSRQHIAYLTDKYALHLAGPCGDKARALLKSTQFDVLSSEEHHHLPPCRIIVNGIDLDSSTEHAKNTPLRTFLRLATAHDRLTEQDLTTTTHLRLHGAEGAMATIVDLYFPSRAGAETLPDDVPNVFVFWNGLFLRDENLVHDCLGYQRLEERNLWKASTSDKSTVLDLFRTDIAARRRLARRRVCLVFLESRNVFAPELHKRHLNRQDPGVKALGNCLPDDSDFMTLRRNYLKRCHQVMRAHDHDEAYPPPTEFDDVALRVATKYLIQKVDRVHFADTFKRNDHVRFRLGSKTTTSDTASTVTNGVGRIRRIYKILEPAQSDPLRQTGLVVLASPLVAPFGDKEDEAKVDTELQQLVVDCFENLHNPSKLDWWRRRSYVCWTRDLEKKITKADAEKEASARFPAQVKLLAVGNKNIHHDDQAWSPNPFDKFENALFSYLAPPPLSFGIPQSSRSRTALLKADICLQLQVKPPSQKLELLDDDDDEEDNSTNAAGWRDVAEVCANPNPETGIVELQYPGELNMIGGWLLRARLKDCDLADYLAQKRIKALDDLCKRSKPPRKKDADVKLPHSRAVVLNLEESEPVVLKVEHAKAAPFEFCLGEPAPEIAVTFFDHMGGVASGAHKVSPGDYNLRHGHSRAWLELAATGEASKCSIELDLSEASLKSVGAAQGGKGRFDEGTLLLTGVRVPELLPAECLIPALPCDVSFHLQLSPELDADDRSKFDLTTFEVVKQGMNGFAYKVRGEVLPNLASVARQDQGAWIVPRTTKGAECQLSAPPSALEWADDNSIPFEDAIRPYEWIECRFRLLTYTEANEEVFVRPGNSSSFEAVVTDADDVQMEHNLDNSAQNNNIGVRLREGVKVHDDGTFSQDVKILAAYAWNGTLSFDYNGLELKTNVRTAVRRIRVDFGDQPAIDIDRKRIAARAGMNDTGESRTNTRALTQHQAASQVAATRFRNENEDGWTPVFHGSIEETIDIDRLQTTHEAPAAVRVTIIDEEGYIDEELQCEVRLEVIALSGRRTTAARFPALIHGITHHDLCCVIKQQGGQIAEALIDRKGTFVMTARLPGDDTALLLESDWIHFQLSAGRPTTLEIKGLPENPSVRIGEPAIDGFMHLAVLDEIGNPCGDRIWQNARVSLTAPDAARGDLVNALIDAELEDISSPPGCFAALPGGWSIRRTFNVDDPDTARFGTTIRVSLKIDDIVLRHDIDISLKPGRVAEVRAEQPSIKVVLNEPLSKPVIWSLHDVCGNGAGPDDDGKTFHLDLLTDRIVAVSKIEITPPTAAGGKRKQKKSKKKRRRGQQHEETQVPGLPPLSASSQPQYEESALDVVEVDGGKLEFNDLAFAWTDEAPMRESIHIRLRPSLSTSAHDESIFFANSNPRVDQISVIVEPSARPVRLEIYSKDTALARIDEDESEEDDWDKQAITSINVPSGQSVLEHIKMLAWDIAGRKVKKCDFLAKMRYKVPNSSQVLALDTLNESASKQWFTQAFEKPARLAFRTGEARAELEVLRIPGPPVTVDIKEVSKNEVEASSAIDCGEDTVYICISAFDADVAMPLEADCDVRIRAQIEDLFGDGAERTMTHAERVGVALLESDDSIGDRLDTAEGVTKGLSKHEVITLRGLDLSSGSIPLDQSCVRVEVVVELLEPVIDGGTDTKMNYIAAPRKVLDTSSIQCYVTLTNEAGVQARDSRIAEKAEAKRRLDDATRELKRKEQALTRTKRDADKLDNALIKRRNDLLTLIQARCDLFRAQADKAQAEAFLDKIRAAANAAHKEAPRAARYPHKVRVQALGAELRRELGGDYIGFVSELLFCKDEAAAAALAAIIVNNRLYLATHDAVAKARILIDARQRDTSEYFALDVSNLAQVPTARSKPLLPLRGPDRAARRAVDLVSCSRPELLKTIANDLLSDAIVFETQAELDAAERGRDAGECPSASARVSKDNPRTVYKSHGRVRLGGSDQSKPPNFVLGAPPIEQDFDNTEEITAAECHLADLKQRYDSLAATVADGDSEDEDLDEDGIDNYLADDISALERKKSEVYQQSNEVKRLKTSLQMLTSSLQESNSPEKRPLRELHPNTSQADSDDEDISPAKKAKRATALSRKRKPSSPPSLQESNSY